MYCTPNDFFTWEELLRPREKESKKSACLPSSSEEAELERFDLAGCSNSSESGSVAKVAARLSFENLFTGIFTTCMRRSKNPYFGLFLFNNE